MTCQVSCIGLFASLCTLSMGFIRGARGGQSVTSTSACSDSLEMDYTIRIKHSYRGQHYNLQNVLILECPDDLFDVAFLPLHGRYSPNRYQTRPLRLQVHTERCNALREACKLKQAHHLLR